MSAPLQGPRNGRVGGGLAKTLYAPQAALTELGEQVYGHVVEAINFRMLGGLEQYLWALIEERGIADDLGEIAKQLIDDAVVRALTDPSRYCSLVPFGITKEEEKAVAFDENCPFCRFEATAGPEEEPHEHKDDACPLCDDDAREWREEHADVLRKHGLAPIRGTPS